MSTETLVLIAVVCGILGALIAPERRRSRTEGALLGLLTGPLGLLVILAWPGPKTDVD